MKGDSTGVSPVIATILLIAITVVAVGVVMAFVAGIGRPVTPVATMLTAENAIDNSVRVRLFHMSGDTIPAVRTNLEVRLNGALKPWGALGADNVTLTGDGDSDGDFEIGDVITASCVNTSLQTGDVLAVVYKPTQQTLLSLTIP